MYITFTLIGVAWATWGIPSINKSDTTPETLGVYVIGFLVTVLLDALISWKKNGDDKKYEQAISVVFMVGSLALIVWASFLSLKSTVVIDSNVTEQWKMFAAPFLLLIFSLAILMSLVLTGIDPKIVSIGALDTPLGQLRNRE